MNVYFDNAATTPLDPAVFEAMKPFLLDHYGNPSSIHAHGRKVRTAVEQARKKVADLLNVTPGEIFFTSGGTEADNTAIRCSIRDRGVKHIISSKVEHHAITHTLKAEEKEGLKVSYVNLNGDGEVDYNHLKELLKNSSNTMVSLMHANNEIGNLLDLVRVGDLCKQYDAIFHSDTVQSMAHYTHDFNQSFYSRWSTGKKYARWNRECLRNCRLSCSDGNCLC
jgi:cysteine desulfurase